MSGSTAVATWIPTSAHLSAPRWKTLTISSSAVRLVRAPRAMGSYLLGALDPHDAAAMITSTTLTSASSSHTGVLLTFRVHLESRNHAWP